MLSTITHSSNYSAVSNIGNENVMYMSASVNNRGEINFGENIVDTELYKENKGEVDNDLQIFKEYVLAQ